MLTWRPAVGWGGSPPAETTAEASEECSVWSSSSCTGLDLSPSRSLTDSGGAWGRAVCCGEARPAGEALRLQTPQTVGSNQMSIKTQRKEVQSTCDEEVLSTNWVFLATNCGSFTNNVQVARTGLINHLISQQLTVNLWITIFPHVKYFVLSKVALPQCRGTAKVLHLKLK